MPERSVIPVTMPKWGFAMKEGCVGDWLVTEGEAVQAGSEVLDVETDKIAGAIEVTHSGILRRAVAQSGETLPIGALLGVIAPADVPDSEIDEFVLQFQNDSVREEAAAEGSGPQPESVKAGDLQINLLRLGTGDRTAILLHGFGGDLNNWLFNHPVLAEQHTVYAVDLPGHGSSSKSVGEGNLASMVAVMRQLLSELRIDQVDLVGHSMGGAIALQLAGTELGLVQSLVLIASAGMGPEINTGYLRGFTESQSRRELKPHVQQLFNDSSLVTRQMVEDVLKYKRIDGVQQSLQTILDSFIDGETQSVDLREALEQSRIPSLVIWGAEDQIISADHAAGLPETVEAHLLQNCGHM
ncbi:MAG: acetoin dehydrogenase dihydrolipoyllysine-residue acetyltransferase subunit, partial [Planctomycetota bacterium]|nr:acetoin dehydrogenase dihydrolipoyllysine-residue acetyltransferase subunit [Planctomycetota bacterium]